MANWFKARIWAMNYEALPETLVSLAIDSLDAEYVEGEHDDDMLNITAPLIDKSVETIDALAGEGNYLVMEWSSDFSNNYQEWDVYVSRGGQWLQATQYESPIPQKLCNGLYKICVEGVDYVCMKKSQEAEITPTCITCAANDKINATALIELNTFGSMGAE